jgi:hypothetical protein
MCMSIFSIMMNLGDHVFIAPVFRTKPVEARNAIQWQSRHSVHSLLLQDPVSNKTQPTI